MIDFTRISDTQCKLIVNVSVFNEEVISKMAYWMSEKYMISWDKMTEDKHLLIFEKTEGLLSDDECKLLKSNISQMLIDFKNRDIINRETGNIRDILYIKAFANSDDYEDFSLTIE